MAEPLLPAECDLRDFAFMPLYIARLQRSKAWLMCKRDPALAFYLLNLWMRAWHEVPAGSIENDDDVLADAAMADPKTWDRIKAKVLRGWEQRDGRLYHSVVTEIAAEQGERKTKQRQRTEAARQAKLQLQAQAARNAATEPVTVSVTENATEDVTDNVTASKGEGEGEERENPSSLRSDGAPAKPSRSKPRSRIADDWQPSADGLAYASDRGVEVDRARTAFVNHHQARGSLMASWDAAWRTWCDREVEYGRAPGISAGKNDTGVPDDPWGFEKWVAEQRAAGNA